MRTPLKMSYQAAKKRAEPYDKIVGELPEMRAQTLDLLATAVVQKIQTYVLVNNRSEGQRIGAACPKPALTAKDWEMFLTTSSGATTRDSGEDWTCSSRRNNS